MRAELGLTIAQAALPLNVFRALSCILLVPAGVAIDKLGAYRILFPGLAAGAAVGLLLPMATNLTQLVVLQSLFAVSKLVGGLAAMQVVVMETFRGAPDVGSAQAVALSGWSAAGAIAPAFIGAMAVRFGWRYAFFALAIIFTSVGIPLAYKYLRKPLVPPHSQPLVTSGSNVPTQTGHDDEPLLPRRFSVLLGVVAAMSVSLHVVLDHLVIFLREDVGFGFGVATRYLSLLNIVGLLAKLIVGPLSDRMGHTGLLAGFAVLAMASSLGFAHAIAVGAVYPLVVLAFVCLYGLGYSAVITLVYTALPGFGLKHAGLRANLNLVVQLGFGVVGSYAGSVLRGSTGSYAAAFYLGAFSWIVGLLFTIASRVRTSRVSTDCT